MPSKRHFVYLWSLANPAIIVPAPTGIVYCNRTDGVATVHRELEGWLLPLPLVQAKVFEPEWWSRNYNRRVAGDDEEWGELCREIESALSKSLSGGEAPTDISVLPDPDSCRAWVRVSFLFAELGPNGDGDHRAPMEGVLTWQNCD